MKNATKLSETQKRNSMLASYDIGTQNVQGWPKKSEPQMLYA